MKYNTVLINTNHFSDYFVGSIEEDNLLSRYFSLGALCTNRHGNVNYFNTKDAAAEFEEVMHTFLMNNPEVLIHLHDNCTKINDQLKFLKYGYVESKGWYEITYRGNNRAWEHDHSLISVKSYSGEEYTTNEPLVMMSSIEKSTHTRVTKIRIPMASVVTSSKFADSTTLQLMTVNANLLLELFLRYTGFSLVSEFEYLFAFASKGLYNPIWDAEKKTNCIKTERYLHLENYICGDQVDCLSHYTNFFFIEYFRVLKNISLNNKRMITQTKEDDFVCVE